MASTACAFLTALALAARADPHRKYVNGDVFMQRYRYNKTEASIPLWKDQEPSLRGPPPYTPPSDWVYNTKAGPRDGMINVHLVPHSHDDTGWQVTVDQYFYQEVYYILDTLLEFLTQDPNRRFMFVETAFFARWWDQQPSTKQEQLSRLVQSGQLEFVNGGWCMHDEAGPYWVEMVDQTTRGHQFLKKNFGSAAYPKGTWQIDPFGHSNTNAWLIGAGSGMFYEFWGRMSYQDFAMRKNESRLEWIWQGSETMGSSAQIFAGELFGAGSGGYGTFIEFDSSTNQVQDDPRRHDYNIDYWVDMFVKSAKAQAAAFRTDHQIWACGSDFNYQNADHWYHNLDKIIHYANLNGTVNAFYSTPTFYVEQKQKAGLTWEVRQDDIFPLGDAAHHYWSGYFTSRPALKRQVHVASNFLNAARQMEVVSGVSKAEIQNPTTRPSPVVGKSWTDSLEGTVGVATHHDGMSGTERQDVADDYALRISESHGEVEEGVALSLKRLMNVDTTFEHCNCNAVGADNCLNITSCPTTTGTTSFDVVAWNSLGRNSSQYLRIPVSFSSATVVGPFGAVRNVQVDAIDARTLSIPLLYLNKFNLTAAQIAAENQRIMNKATHVVSFMAELPPMGYAVYTVAAASQPVTQKIAAAANVIENEYYALTFDMASGQPSKITNKRTNVSTPFSVEFGWYNSSVGGCTPGVVADIACDPQKSGAYIFRPNTSTLFPPGPASVAPKLSFNQGQYVQEVYQNFSNWATLVYRLTAGSKFIDVEWTAGPIPMDTPWIPNVVPNMPNMWGKEVVLRYTTGVQSNGVFYTDSNGKEMVKRVYDKRGPSYPTHTVTEPVAGNYYPVNAMIAVQDQQTEFVVLTEVAQGGASLKNGSVELMVHRRVLDDDARGVQEPLNETMCGCNDINAAPGNMGEYGHEADGGCLCEGLTMRGIHRLIFDTIEAANSERRQQMEEMSFPAVLAFSKTPTGAAVKSRSFLKAAFPPEIKLLTLTNNYVDINDQQLLFRVAHLYSANESSAHSVPVTVNFSEIFGMEGLTIASMQEMSLTATMTVEELDARTFNWSTTPPPQAHEAAPRRSPLQSNGGVFSTVVKPMEVRTFLVQFS